MRDEFIIFAMRSAIIKGGGPLPAPQHQLGSEPLLETNRAPRHPRSPCLDSARDELRLADRSGRKRLHAASRSGAGNRAEGHHRDHDRREAKHQQCFDQQQRPVAQIGGRDSQLVRATLRRKCPAAIARSMVVR